MKLNDYFDYWDNFVSKWQQSVSEAAYSSVHSKHRIYKAYPDFSFPGGIMNTDKSSLPSYDYLPEPYWGWTPCCREKNLEMVVVNYNPGSGGELQNRRSLIIGKKQAYTDYVREQVESFVDFRTKKPVTKPGQYDTSNWHYNNRAKKLSIALNTSVNFPAIEKYLGIELVPWHTKTVLGLGDYIKKNDKAVKHWSLGFAIAAASKIKGRLNNKIIVRTCKSTFQRIFAEDFNSGYMYWGKNVPSIRQPNNDNLQIVYLRSHPNVEIILLWGMRNALPSVPFMHKYI